TSRLRTSSSTRRAEIGLDDLRIALHHRWRALGDFLTVIEHHHAVADVHHQAHVMLDQEHGDAFVADAADELAERQPLRRIHAGGGLVQREQPRLGGERTGNFQPALIAVRQAPRAVVGAGADADVIEQRQGARQNLALLGERARVAQHRAEHAGPRAHVAADHHILERREVGEEPDVLKGARDAGGGNFMRRQRRDIALGEAKAAAVGCVDTGEQVEKRRLACPVRADQAIDVARGDGEGDVLQRLQSAEALRCACDLEERAHVACSVSSRLRTAEGSSPAGRKSMTSTSARPKSSMRITSGSISERPNSASCTGSTVQRSTSGVNDSSSAPSITPQMLPMPPSTTIDTTITDSTSTKLSGEMNAWIAENMPPAMPPKLAPIAKARSFMFRVLMPMARAAISSSRIASHARPMREFCSRRLTTMTASITSSSR